MTIYYPSDVPEISATLKLYFLVGKSKKSQSVFMSVSLRPTETTHTQTPCLTDWEVGTTKIYHYYYMQVISVHTPFYPNIVY